MTAPPPARTLNFGASVTASLLVKMTSTYGMSERRDKMITYSRVDNLIRDQMPQNQGELDATLFVGRGHEGKPHQKPREKLGLRETGYELETE